MSGLPGGAVTPGGCGSRCRCRCRCRARVEAAAGQPPLRTGSNLRVLPLAVKKSKAKVGISRALCESRGRPAGEGEMVPAGAAGRGLRSFPAALQETRRRSRPLSGAQPCRVSALRGGGTEGHFACKPYDMRSR